MVPDGDLENDQFLILISFSQFRITIYWIAPVRISRYIPVSDVQLKGPTTIVTNTFIWTL